MLLLVPWAPVENVTMGLGLGSTVPVPEELNAAEEGWVLRYPW